MSALAAHTWKEYRKLTPLGASIAFIAAGTARGAYRKGAA